MKEYQGIKFLCESKLQTNLFDNYYLKTIIEIPIIEPD